MADHEAPAGAVSFAGAVLDRYRHVCAFVNGSVDSAGYYAAEAEGTARR